MPCQEPGADNAPTRDDDRREAIMKAIGYVRCAVCGEITRGYPPRGWKSGDELATWFHGVPRVERSRCNGSYKPGTDTHLDVDSPLRATTTEGKP